MHKADLKRNLEAELLKIERQDKKIYGVGETRYDLMIKDVLIYIDNSISKEAIEEKIEELQKEYEEILSDYGNIDTDIMFNITNENVRKYLDKIVDKIIILQELLEGK